MPLLPFKLERYAYIVDLYMSRGKHVLLMGEEGSGKTTFVQVRHNLSPMCVLLLFTSLSCRTVSSLVCH